MSKLIKIIASILIAVFVLASLALLVPPLLGITTVVSKPALDTNISMGSVVYATRKPITDIYTGDEIIYEDETSAYVYRVEQVDVSNGEVYVANETDKTEGTIRTGSSAMQKRFAIPFIGYILIALESSEGLILLGLGVACLITLLILGEVIDRRHRKYDDDDEEEYADEDSYFSGLAKSVNEPHKLDELADSPSATGKTAPVAAAAVEAAAEAPQQVSEDLAATRAVVIERPQEVKEAAEEAAAAAEEKAEEINEAPVVSAADDFIEEDDDDMELDEIAKAEAEARAAQAKLEALKAAAAAKNAETVILPEAAEKMKAAEEVKAPAEEKVKETKPADAQPEVKSEKPAKQETVIRNTVPETMQAVAKEIDVDLADGIEQIPEEEDSAVKHDLNESELPGVEAALEAALATTQVSRSTQMRKPVEPEVVPEASEELDEIELAIPVRTLDEYLQVAYTNGDDPQVIKDNTTGVNLVDFSDCFKKQ